MICAFQHRSSAIETWVFDLDNTLYHPSARLFDQINHRMTAFIMAELEISAADADRLRKDYWNRFGTTLAGLIENHQIEPDAFLAACHDIDLSALAPDKRLAAALDRIRGRRVIHTNGARAHAERVLARLGLSGAFDAIYGIEDTGLIPKPRAAAFDRVASLAGFEPSRAAMIEDDPRNLIIPHSRGMATLLVSGGPHDGPSGAHVHSVTADLAAFLANLASPGRASEDGLRSEAG